MAITFPASPVNGQTHTENGQIFVFDSTRGYWLLKKQDQIVASTSRSTFVATAGQTVHTVNYDPSASVIVSVNGVMLNPQDVTATNGTSITFDTALTLSDEVDIVFHQPTAANLSRHSVSDTAPSDASSGDLWFNSANLKTYVYYDDGSSAQWVATNPLGVDGADGADGSSVTTYANFAAFVNGTTEGDFAFAQDTKALYVWDGAEWDRISVGIDESPVIITEPPTEHTLNADGSTSNITMVADDPEGFDITYGIVYGTTNNTLPSLLSSAASVDSNGVYTFTPSTNSTDAGSVKVRLSASDGAKTTTRICTLSLAFISTVDYLVVGGGGGGGMRHGGGGGAGGYIYSTNQTLNTGTTYNIVVGTGGAAGNGQSAPGSNGLDSSISGTAFNTITAIGGGLGATLDAAGDGGSGGGGGHNGVTAGTGTVGQGNDGGTGQAGHPYHAGGGGGAGGAGANAGSIGGAGGAGLQNSITGTALYYAGGGGGGTYNTSGNAAGGSGVGGNGGGGTGAAGSPTPNTGSGGGGSGGGSLPNHGTPTAGADGIVIIRSIDTATSTTGSPTITTDGSYNIYQFTQSGSITF